MENENKDKSFHTVIIVKIILFIFGCISMIGPLNIKHDRADFWEYQDSEKLTVLAEIKSIRFVPKYHKIISYIPAHYDCLFEYYVDGHKIQNNGQIFLAKDKLFVQRTNSVVIQYDSSEKKVGDKVTLNVYKDKYGNYKIAKFRFVEDNRWGDFWSFLLCAFGVLAFFVVRFC